MKIESGRKNENLTGQLVDQRDQAKVHCTQGLIEILGSMVIFEENQGVSDLNKYEFLRPIYVKIIKFLVI